MIWWMTSLSSGLLDRTVSFMATFLVASIPKLSLTTTWTEQARHSVLPGCRNWGSAPHWGAPG